MSLPKIKFLSPELILGLILAISFVLRIWSIENAPPSLYWDEMDAGYQAYSILKTGKDYFGETPFLVVHSFADFRAPILIYSIIPFVALLGLNVLAIKLPVILLGVLAVFLTYVLTLQLFKSKTTALIAALFVSLAPWNLQYSRITYEAIPMLALFLGGLTLFLKGLEKQKYFILSSIIFSLSLFTYNTMKLFVPMVLLTLAVIYFKKLKINKYVIISTAIFAIAFTTSLYGTIFQNGGQRFTEISVFSDPQNSSQIDYLRQYSSVAYSDSPQVGQPPRIIDKLVFNKPLLLLDRITQNYLAAFSLDFLFVRGDPLPRHSPSTVGELFRVEVITVLLGLIFLAMNIKKNPSSILILLWILIAPISAVVTRDGSNHATRLFMLFPALTITSALGVSYLWGILTNKLKPLFLIFVLAWIFCAVSYLNYYYGAYNLENAKAFQFRFNEAVNIALENKSNYEYVIIDDRTDSALMNYLFVSKYDPAIFQNLVKSNTLSTDIVGFPGNRIDNVILMQPKMKNWDNAFSINQFDKNYLLIVSPEQMNEQTVDKLYKKLTQNQKHLDTVNYKTGDPAFYVIESQKPIKNENP